MFNYSNYDQYELGSAPCNESCVQVTKEGDYSEAMLAECRRYKKMLEERFPDFTLHDVLFKITRNPHDFGDYYEVAIRFDTTNEECVEFACFVEDNLPAKWDDTAVLRYEMKGLAQDEEICSEEKTKDVGASA